MEYGSEKNMTFLIKILNNLNINYTDLARAAGVTPQLVNYWIEHDDIKLARLIQSMEGLGVRIQCHFQEVEQKAHLELSDNIFDIQLYNVSKYRKALPGTGFIIEQAIKNNARLKFLAQLAKDMNLSLIEFSEKIGRNYQSMHHCFKVDDIKISIIYDIARQTGRKVIWQLSPIEKDEKTTTTNIE